MFKRFKRTDCHISYHLKGPNGELVFGEMLLNFSGALTMKKITEIREYISEQNNGAQVIILSITKLEG